MDELRERSNAQANVMALSEDIDAELIMKNKYVRLWMVFVWIASGTIMAWYFAQIIEQYQQSVASPVSAVTYITEQRLPFPTVVICNWNQLGSLQEPNPGNQTCPQCQLTLSSCFDWNNNIDCSQDWVLETIQTRGGLFYCGVYNQNPANITYSAAIGYSGSIATVWQVLDFPAEDPPENRAGVQATFLVDDGTPIDPEGIWDEVRFARPGFDSFFAMQLVSTVHDELSSSDSNYNVTSYATVVSQVTLLYPQNPNYSYVGVSFAFQGSLSQEIIQFDIGYTLNNLFGDFSGMLGTLMGLDTIKVFSSLPLVWLSLKLRNINPIEDHFNG